MKDLVKITSFNPDNKVTLEYEQPFGETMALIVRPGNFGFQKLTFEFPNGGYVSYERISDES